MIRGPGKGIGLLTLLLLSGQAAATGYFLNGSGTNTRGIGGAGVALAQDPMAVAGNPAAGVALDGVRGELGATFLRPRPKFSAGPLPANSLRPGSFPVKPGFYESDPDVPLQFEGTFAIPTGAINWRLNDRWALALSLYGNGGLNSTFDGFANEFCPPNSRQSGILCGGTLSSDIGQTFIAPSAAWQATPWLRLGISPLLVWQALEIRGYEAFSGRSQDPENFTNNGHDHALGYGIKAGLQAHLYRGVSFGLTLQSKIEMDEFDDYAGLLPEQGRLEIPPIVQVGFGWDITPRITLATDYARIFYSSIASTGNPGDATAPFGADEGPGFGWDDVQSYKFGLIFRATPKWTLRAGYASGNIQLESEDLFFNLISGSLIANEYHLGVAHHVSERTTVKVSAHMFDGACLRGNNPTLPEQELDLYLYGLSMDFSVERHF